MRTKRRIRVWALASTLLALFILVALTAAAGAQQPTLTEEDQVPGPVVTIVAPVVADSLLHQWYPDRNYGQAWAIPFRTNDVGAAMFKFDLSAIQPIGRVRVEKATLMVYVGSRSNDSGLLASAHRIKRPWSEPEVTWLNADATQPWERPGCNGPTDRDPISSDETLVLFSVDKGWVAVDVTGIVQSWFDGAPDHGIVLKGKTGNHVAYDLASRDQPNPLLDPYLEIGYEELPTPTPTLTPTATPTPLPEMLLAKTGPSGPVQVGRDLIINYEIQLTNSAQQVVTGVVVTDVLPLGTEFLACSSGCTFDSPDPDLRFAVWEIDEMGALEQMTVTLDLRLPAWVQEQGNIVNLVRGTCNECQTVHEAYWEIPVLVPTPTATPRLQQQYLPLLLK